MKRSKKLAEMIVVIIFLGIILLIQKCIFTMENIIVLSNTKQRLTIERAELMARSVRASSPGVCRLECHMSEPRPIRHLYQSAQFTLLCITKHSCSVLFELRKGHWPMERGEQKKPKVSHTFLSEFKVLYIL